LSSLKLFSAIIAERVPLLTARRRVELGAGGGLVGLALALAVSRSSYRFGQPLLITDLPVLIPLQEKNISLNALGPDTISSLPLPWGSPLPAGLPDEYRKPDVIFAADCVYFEPSFPLLMDTLADLMGPGTVCWFCMKKRRKADMRFVTALKKAFLVKEVEVEQEADGKGVIL
jgi:protein N-lysine methyltransferase METTL21A